MTLRAADVVKHAILGEAAGPSGNVQNVPLSRVVGISDNCLVVVAHLRIPPCDWFVVWLSLQRVSRKSWTVLHLGTPSLQRTFQRPSGRLWRRAKSGSFVSARPNSRSRPAISAL